MDEMGDGGLIMNADPLSTSDAAPMRDLSTVEGFVPNRIDAAALALTEDNLLGTMINFGSDLHTAMGYNSDLILILALVKIYLLMLTHNIGMSCGLLKVMNTLRRWLLNMVRCQRPPSTLTSWESRDSCIV